MLSEAIHALFGGAMDISKEADSAGRPDLDCLCEGEPVVVRATSCQDYFRVEACETTAYKYLGLHKKDGWCTHRYIIRDAAITVADIEILISKVDALNGSCKVEGHCLVIDIPPECDYHPRTDLRPDLSP